VGSGRSLPWPSQGSIWSAVRHDMALSLFPSDRFSDAQHDVLACFGHMLQQRALAIAWYVIDERYVRQVFAVERVHLGIEAVIPVPVPLLACSTHPDTPRPRPVRYALQLQALQLEPLAARQSANDRLLRPCFAIGVLDLDAV